MAAGVLAERSTSEREDNETGREKKVVMNGNHGVSNAKAKKQSKKKQMKQSAVLAEAGVAESPDGATEIGEIEPVDAGGKKRKEPEAEKGGSEALDTKKKNKKKKGKQSGAATSEGGEVDSTERSSHDDVQGSGDAALENGSQAEAKGSKKKDKKEKRQNVNLRGPSDAAASVPSAAIGSAAPAAPPSASAWKDVPVRVEGILPRADSAADVTSVPAGECPLLGGWLRPLSSFSEVSDRLDGRLMEAFAGFSHPSPVQRWAWPVLLHGSEASGGGNGARTGENGGKVERRDLIAIAATGSGKTLAFGLPGLMRILAGKKNGGGEKGRKEKGEDVCHPGMLVLAPTRELAQQIAEVLTSAGDKCGVTVTCVVGGMSKGAQRSEMKRKKADVIVATPGRLRDHMEDGTLALSRVQFVVMDEADRMLDFGFEPEVRAILSATPNTRQTAMLSATWPSAVAKLALEFLKHPVKVSVGESGGDQLSANRDVEQIVEVIDSRARDSRLLTLLQKYHSSRKNRVLVFVLYKKEAQRIEGFLSSRGWKAAAIHGDKSQVLRTQAVADFKAGTMPLLVATDVAARGLDIPQVECVINFSFPLTTEDYVHRIGRTGRAGSKGVAHTLFTTDDKARAGELVNVLREANQEVPADLLKFDLTVRKKESKLYGAHFREISSTAAAPKKITFNDSDDE